MKVTISIKKIKNEARPDLPWRWKVKYGPGTISSTCESELAAIIAATDVARDELGWWERLHAEGR